MTKYTETLTITVPAALAGTAAAMGRAFDPDTGGDKSFHPDADGLTISMTTPCRPEFKAGAIRMLQHPDEAYAFCLAEYARRWPDLTPPTLSEVHAFCVAAEWA